METIFVCRKCGKRKTASPRLGGRQRFCNLAKCQRARKSEWQRNKIESDVLYRETEALSQKKWADRNNGYWKQYRHQKPEKAERNRILQIVRNRKQKALSIKEDRSLIAKMDSITAFKLSIFKRNTEYLLIPLIAKMDAIRVKVVHDSLG